MFFDQRDHRARRSRLQLRLDLRLGGTGSPKYFAVTSCPLARSIPSRRLRSSAPCLNAASFMQAASFLVEPTALVRHDRDRRSCPAEPCHLRRLGHDPRALAPDRADHLDTRLGIQCPASPAPCPNSRGP
eukprot:4583023-Pyramimonas_sp.AAC.1